MPLTEAQRLAFLKGREKRMANLEKKKLEKKELEQNEILRMLAEELGEMEKEDTPEKPKLVRKPRKTKEAKEAKEVKVKVDPSEADTEPETDPEVETKADTKAGAKAETKADPAPPAAVSENRAAPAGFQFDEDAIANKVVAMLLEKGVGVPAAPGNEPPPLKAKKPKVARATSARSNSNAGSNETRFPQSYPPQSASFSWM